MRQSVLERLRRWREVATALALAGFSAWLVWLGGYLLAPAGTVALAVAAGWIWVALRRMRFTQTADVPGIVDVDEGQIAYFGPSSGGFVGVSELTEIRLVKIRGGLYWRLIQAEGPALLVPNGAQGSEFLLDAFASLPGIDLAAVASAASAGSTDALIWRRATRGLLT